MKKTKEFPEKVFIDGKEFDVTGVDAHGFFIIDRPVKVGAKTAVALIVVEVEE